MRVLILHSRYRSGFVSGENRVVDDEAQLLRQAGHSVSLWTPAPSDDGPVSTVRSGVAAVWSAAARRELRSLIDRARPDLVHVHNLFPMLSPAVLRAVPQKIPVVWSLHNYRLFCIAGTLLRNGAVCEACLGHSPWTGVRYRCYRSSFGGSTALALSLTLHKEINSFGRVDSHLAVSDFVRRKYIEAGVNSESIQVKRHFAWPSETRSGPGEYFLYVGRLSGEKGLRGLLEEWSGQSLPLVIAGDGPDQAALRAIAPNNVRFMGAVRPEQVTQLLLQARALIIPSIWYETAGRVVLEAYAARVPVVATAIGGLPEVVYDGVTGVLVPHADTRKWSLALRALSDSSASVELGDAAYALWERRFTPAAGLRGLEDAYATACGHQARGPAHGVSVGSSTTDEYT